VLFQTSESYISENFFIDHYKWNSHNIVQADSWVYTYFSSKMAVNAQFSMDVRKIGEANAIFYTVGFGLDLRNANLTVDNILSDEDFNVLYNSGYSIGFIKVNS
jgi:hypothetical protein